MASSESELKSLIYQIVYRKYKEGYAPRSRFISLISLISRLFSLVTSLDLKSQPQPEVRSIISRIVYISLSKPGSELVSLVTQLISGLSSIEPNKKLEPKLEGELSSLINLINAHINYMDPNMELWSLFRRLFSVVDYMDSDSDSDSEQEPGPEAEAEGVPEPEQLISLCPQMEVQLLRGKFCVAENFLWKKEENDNCNLKNRKLLRLTRGARITHFFCRHCKGEKHEDCRKAPHEVKHPLHPRHSLQLVLWRMFQQRYDRRCYCCDENLIRIFYYCRACDCAINIACVEKAPVLSVHHPRWHEHTLSLFPRQTSLPCNLCALPHSRCAFYICPPCLFVAHQTCISLPSVIKISRHLHRISFTPTFSRGNWFCGVCRKKIRNDYGGYSCIHNTCSFSAHSDCATQSNLWDGKELEGTPEEDVDDEGAEPFLRISDGIIRHFSHHQHHLSLDVNTNRNYDENRLCQACIMPIYFGNLYSCMQCDFFLHEECANLSRKIQHPIHPHVLTLATVATTRINIQNSCSACPWLCASGFFYECDKEGCSFKLHVQCATVSEPLVHGSHMHPLFLTSKPGERRRCSVCTGIRNDFSETFNCIECNFSLCFMCATIPQKVRYKHDKHMFTLSYGKETSSMMYWCEACERAINPKGQFYTCHESCSVMLHTYCLIGEDLYMKPGLLLIHSTGVNIDVLPNNHCMSRPICKLCKERCPYKVVFQSSGFIFCSRSCVIRGFWREIDQIA